MKRLGILSAFFTTMLLATLLGAAPAEAQVAVQGKAARVTPGMDCFRTFTSGTGLGFFGWCFTQDGNVARFETPAANEHIRVGLFLDGYAVCSNIGVEAFDYGSGSAGEGFLNPSTFPANNIVQRTTTNGRFRIRMVFTQNTIEKLLFVKMFVTNTSGASIGNVRVSRFTDLDVDGETSNRWEQTGQSVVAVRDTGIAFTSQLGGNKTVTIESFSDLNSDSGCDATTPLAPPRLNEDNTARITYNLGALLSNQTKVSVFRYSRF